MLRRSMIHLCWLSLAAGCSIYRPDSRREVVVPANPSYQHRHESIESLGSDANWWETFQSDPLKELIESALQNNLSLKQLQARLEQAQARVKQSGGRLFPTLDAAGDYEGRWILDEDSNDSGDSDYREFSSLGALLNWEVDVWGRLRATRSADRLEAKAAYEDWLGGRLLLSAAVAETYFEILEQRGQRKLIQDQIASNDTLLELTRLRFGQGQSSIVDVLQQQEQLASTRALLPLVNARLQELEYAMDILLGAAPGSRKRLESDRLLPYPRFPEMGLPSDLLDQRPDLLAAQSRLASVDFRIAEAVADRFPRFNLGAGLRATGTPGVESVVLNFIGGLTAPVLDGGLRKAEVELRRAELREALAFYSERYLQAVADVETAVVRDREQAEHVERLAGQLEIAQRLLRETRNRYSQGLTDYLPVLAALVRVQDLERDLLTQRRVHLSTHVGIYRALGGPVQLNAALEESGKAHSIL